MVHGRHTHEPDWRPEVIPTLDHQVHLEELVEIEKEPREVRHEEHADHAHQEHGQLQVLGLERM